MFFPFHFINWKHIFNWHLNSLKRRNYYFKGFRTSHFFEYREIQIHISIMHVVWVTIYTYTFPKRDILKVATFRVDKKNIQQLMLLMKITILRNPQFSYHSFMLTTSLKPIKIHHFPSKSTFHGTQSKCK